MLNELLEAPFPGDAEELLHLRRQARQWLGELKVCERSRLQWLLIAENASRLQGVPRLSAWRWLLLRARVTLIEHVQALRTWVSGS